MIYVSLYLFRTAGAELDKWWNNYKEQNAKPIVFCEALKELGEELKRRLEHVADSVGKLMNDGWECELGQGQIRCRKDGINSKSDAYHRITTLDLPSECVGIHAVEEQLEVEEQQTDVSDVGC